ncbi:MAG: hypothetical protein AAF587_02355 [Bacteroidota bacterium]
MNRIIPKARRSLQHLLLILSACFLLACGSTHESITSELNPYVTLDNDRLKVQISSLGAELQSIVNKQSGREVLWIGDSTYWEQKSPIMFPVNVRFKDDQFSYQSKVYQMPSMGLAMIQEFVQEPDNSPQKTTFSFQSSEQSRTNYPFDFRLEVQYELQQQTLINRFILKNTGTDSMYFALGGHPGFYCPLDNGKTRADYEYVFPEPLSISRIEVAGNFLQDNIIPFLSNESRLSLADERIPNGGMFMKASNIQTIGIAETGKAPFVSLNLGDFPNINLWSPPGSPYACIEPMVSHHDIELSPIEIEKKSHLIVLPPGGTNTYAYSIIVHDTP